MNSLRMSDTANTASNDAIHLPITLFRPPVRVYFYLFFSFINSYQYYLTELVCPTSPASNDGVQLPLTCRKRCEIVFFFPPPIFLFVLTIICTGQSSYVRHHQHTIERCRLMIANNASNDHDHDYGFDHHHTTTVSSTGSRAGARIDDTKETLVAVAGWTQGSRSSRHNASLAQVRLFSFFLSLIISNVYIVDHHTSSD